MRTTPPLLSTTTALGRVRGFTVTLLFLLYEGQKRCCDLVEITSKKHNFVWRYLENMRKYGLVEKNEAFWFLTDLGVYFTEYLKNHYNLLNNNIKEYRKKIERKSKESQKIEKKEAKQIPLSAWLASSSLDEVEKRVVEELVEHYNRTGSAFKYFADVYELAEHFKCTPNEIAEALKHLKQDKVVYSWRDKTFNAWKIGLYRAFIFQFLLQQSFSA
ncbi:MAG: hypothetical protein QW161_06425 [Candidatus Bathyarchaeia archaeon]